MLSQACFERLAVGKRHNAALLLCMGEQRLRWPNAGAHHVAAPHTFHTTHVSGVFVPSPAASTCMLYQAVPDDLKQRLPLFGPLRLAPGATRQLGVMDAPLGCVTVVFVHMVGAASLLAWDKVRINYM